MNIKQLYIHRHYLNSSIIQLYILVSCFHNPNFDMLSCCWHVVQIPLIHIIKFSSNAYWLCLKIFYVLVFKVINLYHYFSIAFWTKPCNCRLSSSTFALSYFKQADFSVTWFSCFQRFSILVDYDVMITIGRFLVQPH